MNVFPYPKVKIVCGRRASSLTQESSVEIEIYHLRKRKWISTGVKVLPENWNDSKWIVGRADAFDANLIIESLYTKIQNYIRKLVIDGEQFNWNSFESFLHDDDKYRSFVDFVKDRIEKRNDITNSSKRNHRKFHKALIDFGKIVLFKDLTKVNIQKYDEWLHNRRNYKQTTIASYHKYMKVYIHEALRMEYIITNPYEGFKINQGKPAGRKFLTVEELEAIEHSMMPTASIERVRDMFIFQCYTGLAYSDMKKFNFNNVINKSGR